MLGWCVETTVIAAGLAALALLAGRRGRLTPEARHALWLVVLIKFLVPPVVAWPWALGDRPSVAASAVRAEVEAPPAAVEPPRPEAAPEVVAAELPEAFAPPADPEPAPAAVDRVVLPPEPVPIPAEPVAVLPAPWRFDGWALLGAAWLVGSVVVAARGGIRIARFRRTLRSGDPAPAWLGAEVAGVARGLGVTRSPAVLVVAGLPTPLLWCLGRPRLVVPDGLDRLTPEARAGLLAHELAHLARRDHWVVRLELLAGLAWWWNPVFRLVARRLRDEAEAACDARVVRAFPGYRIAYAEALIEVCERHARPVPPLPALGIGGPSAARTLEARLLMILRDPIRPPSRWLPLVALALLALALPTWTLARQDPAQPAGPPRVEAASPANPPPASDPAPVSVPAPPAPAPVVSPSILAPGQHLLPAPNTAPWTVERIQEGVKKRSWPDRSLAFRATATTRQVSKSFAGRRVGVRVADVILGRQAPTNPMFSNAWSLLGQVSRFDALRALVPAAGVGQPAWSRRFTAQVGTETVAFDSSSTSTGAVPIRWTAAVAGTPPPDPAQADPLFGRLGGKPAVSPGAFEPPPASLLDLSGPTSLIFNNPWFRSQVAGVETRDDVELIRVAWIATAGGERPAPHGLYWVAPGLGFAVVRFEAIALLAEAPGSARQTWRKEASGFRPVGDLWLPSRVDYKAASLQPTATDTLKVTDSLELVATFEDYRVNPDLPDDTFQPRLTIGALDEATGQFTAVPPEVPPGLVDRLGRAVAASPFGPPGTEPPPPAAAGAPAGPAAPGVHPTEVAHERTDGFFGEPTKEQATQQLINKLERGLTARLDQLRTADPAAPAVVTNGPGVADPKTEEIRRQVDRTPELVALKAEWNKLYDRAEKIQKDTKNIGDPAEITARKKLSQIKIEHDKLREQLIAELANRPPSTPPNSPIRLAQARRDAQAAEVERVEAQRDQAALELKNTEKLASSKNPAVSKDEVALYQVKLRAAEAQVARERARLAEADALLRQPDPAPSRSPNPAPGELPVLQARRAIQAAEVERSEAERDRTNSSSRRADALLKRNAIEREEYDQIRANARIAETEVARAQARLAEADALLDQAKAPRAADTDLTPAGTRPVAVLNDYREQAELAEVYVQVKRAELQQAEMKVARARALLDAREPLAKEGRITAREIGEFRDQLGATQDEARIKEVEVREAELRLKQAQRRADTEEARLKRLAERAKVELDRLKELHRSGQKTMQDMDDAQGRYDDLMFQLDPTYKPESKPELTQTREETARKVNLKLKLLSAGAALDEAWAKLDQGTIDSKQFEALRDRYNSLRLQLDPSENLEPK